MALFRIISIDAILEINYRFTQFKCAGARKGAVEGCYSSFHYYASLQEQIASIVASLIKATSLWMATSAQPLWSISSCHF